jgi:hypothetical protein
MRLVELKKGKFFLSEKVRFFGDDLISKIALAVFKNIVRIKKLINRELSILPKRILKITHSLWSVLSNKIDSFYEKVHNRKRVKKDTSLDNHKGSVSIYWKSVSDDLKR